jgi:hypothetical protein
MSEPREPVDPPPGPFVVPPQASPFPPLDGEGSGDARSDWNRGADAHDLAGTSGRLDALRRFAFPPDEPPGEAELAARDLRWTSRVILVTTVVLLIFNIAAVQNWARQQAPGWGSATVRELADVWDARMALLGADQPRQGLREAYEAFRDARFPGQEGATEDRD